jgi:hypothetical protein
VLFLEKNFFISFGEWLRGFHELLGVIPVFPFIVIKVLV